MSVETKELPLALQQAFRSAPDGLMVMDRRRRYVLVSEGLTRITGADQAAVTESDCVCEQLQGAQCTYGDRVSKGDCPMHSILGGQGGTARRRLDLRRTDGEKVRVETCYFPVRDDNNGIVFAVGVMREMAGEPEPSIEHTRLAAREGHRLANSLVVAAPPGGATPDDEVPVLDRTLNVVERQEILDALTRARGRRTLAAKLLGISRSRLYRRMDMLGIESERTT